MGLALGQKRQGHDVSFACGRWHRKAEKEDSVEVQASRRGLEPDVLYLDKHFSVNHAFQDVRRLREIVRTRGIRMIHAHMENAHLVAALAARKRAPHPCVVSTSYEPEGPTPGARSWWLYRRCTDGLVVICDAAKAAALERFGLAEEKVEVIEPGIDLDVFDPGRTVQDERAKLGFGMDDFVLGLVSRLRKDRRIDIPVDAVAQLTERCPNLRLFIVGRGELEEPLRVEMAKRGLAGRIVVGGYRRGEQLVGAYRTMDVLVYPVPGTDRSCQTVREAMAAGVPVVASRTGFLSDLIDEGRTGLFMELSSESLARHAEALYKGRERVGALSKAALATARRRFSLDLQAERTCAFYERLLGNGCRST